jgi:hypothetical protein
MQPITVPPRFMPLSQVKGQEYCIFPWANQDYVPKNFEGIRESSADLSFARAMETRGFGLLSKVSYEGVLEIPIQIVFPEGLLATFQELDSFIKSPEFDFGNKAQVEIRDAYAYMSFFEKYKGFFGPKLRLS